MYFDGTPNFGGKITCLVPRRGDLLGQVFLEVTLPPIQIPGNTDPVSYVNSIGHALIQEISLEIGEQEIDKQTGEWMELWSNLTTTDSKKYGFYDMIGKVDGYVPPEIYGPTKLYIPLQFWFCKTPGLHLPLLALQYHPVRIVLTLRKLQDLFYIPNMVINCSTQVTAIGNPDIMLWGDYVYLDKEERRHFVKNTHEYLIEQVQYTASPQSIPKNNITQTIRLEFNHPIREILWLISRKINQQYHEWFNYSSLSLEEQGRRTDLLGTALIQLDGYDRFQVRDAGYFRLVQAWQHHTVIANNEFIYLYSFALRPEDLQPSGSMNASRIDSLVLQVGMNTNLTAEQRGDVDVMVYAKNHNVLRIAEGFGGLLFTV